MPVTSFCDVDINLFLGRSHIVIICLNFPGFCEGNLKFLI